MSTNKRRNNSNIPLTKEELDKIDKLIEEEKMKHRNWSFNDLDKMKYLKYDRKISPIVIHNAGIFPDKSYHQIYYIYKKV